MVERTLRGMRSSLRTLEAALALFGERGYEATTMREIAKRTGSALGAVYRHFPTKESLGLALYERLALDLESWLPMMPEGSMAQRFAATMEAKFALLEPYREALGALFARALDPRDRLGVLSPWTTRIRARVSGVFLTVVQGAEDGPEGEEAARWGHLLYGIHLALILAWMQDTGDQKKVAQQALGLAQQALMFLPMLQALPQASDFLMRADDVFRQLFWTQEEGSSSDKARRILDCVFRRRRLLPGVEVEGPTEAALAPHLGRVEAFLQRDEPIHLVLPAFPAKTPNTQKVLGKLPDMAEALALRSLQSLCEEIAEYHPPGAHLTICSDGQVFADLVGVSDADVEAYTEALLRMCTRLDATQLAMFSMKDAFGALTPDEARAQLCTHYATPLEQLRAWTKESARFATQVDGIHRFLFEDESARDPSCTRNQARKRTRARAYEVVQRSEAWGRLVAACFPEALRLSIHPQPEVSEKIGIHLVEVEDVWLTPWHSVAVLEGERFHLMKRQDAEARGAQLVFEDDQPSHMELVHDVHPS